MSDSDRQIHLGFTIWPTGFHPAAWRLEGAASDGNSNAKFLQNAIRTAERGLFDFFFIGDRVVGLTSSQFAAPNEVLRPEALTLAANLAAVTENIGIIATVNTTYSEPYNVARSLATIDHMSGGRIGLNVVTGRNEEAARNFSRERHWDNSHRYDWATEFIEVLQGLWDSWEDDARIADRASGTFVDENKVHAVNYRGQFFEIDGPLNVERPVQGQIPIINAGASERSRDLGARFSDIRFTNSSSLGLEGAKEYYADIKGRLAAYGRRDEDQSLITGAAVYVRETARAAHEHYRELQNLVVARGAVKLDKLGEALGVDLTGVDTEAAIGDVVDLAIITDEGRIILDKARELFGQDRVTVRQAGVSFTRGSFFLEAVGSASDIADTFEQWFSERAADGFMVFPPTMPEGLEAFVDLVVPELQRRGLYRTAYESSTLRGHFGLERPANQFATSQFATPQFATPAGAE
jgi:FMN-dependent oxidoreductase (nitrilotriacetate monooxygenase family)